MGAQELTLCDVIENPPGGFCFFLKGAPQLSLAGGGEDFMVSNPQQCCRVYGDRAPVAESLPGCPRHTSSGAFVPGGGKPLKFLWLGRWRDLHRPWPPSSCGNSY